MVVFGPPQWQYRTREWVLDCGRSTVELVFDGMTATLIPVAGMLSRPSGSWAGASLSVVLDATRVRRGDDRADARLRAGSGLDADRHPHIRWQGHIVRPALDGTFELSGLLTFRGTHQPLILEGAEVDGGERVQRLTARARLAPPPCRVDRSRASAAWDILGPPAVEIVAHLEWVPVTETDDPLPAA